MSTPAQLASDPANMTSNPGEIPPPSPCGGPRTPEGKAISSANSTKHGLFTAQDFVRPGEEPLYTELTNSLRDELSPNGPLELNLVAEIRRAMWRLRRCGEVEADLAVSLDDGRGLSFDPMGTASTDTAKAQLAVDRARSQAHRLLHKSTTELRTLQTERQCRNLYYEPGTDTRFLGVCNLSSVRNKIDAADIAQCRRQHLADNAQIDALLAAPHPPPATPGSFCKTPRNAECPCKSGLKYKRCCGKGAPAVLHAA